MTFAIAARTEAGWAMAASTYPMNVGHNVFAAIPGVGVAITMNYAPTDAGMRCLKRMGGGETPAGSIEPETSQPDWHQWHIGVVGKDRAAFDTGATHTPHFSWVLENDLIAVGSLMRGPGVPEAMVEAWRRNCDEGTKQRLQLALEAGRDAGGDLRGMLSASAMVVSAEIEVADVNSSPGDPIADLRQTPLVSIDQREPLESRYLDGTNAWIALMNGEVEEALRYRELWTPGLRSAYAGAVDYMEAVLALQLGWPESDELVAKLHSEMPNWIEFARRGGEFADVFRKAGVI